MSSIVVFLGPSLPREEAMRTLSAVYVPPAARGDVYRWCASKPAAIALVDGFFDRVPAVWHKEILYALERGIPVFGAASMGALRAVELAAFGMVGVGQIFESFRSGEYEDDDEVAIAHASSGEAYRPLSEAMANIRATVTAAVASNILRPETGTTVVLAAKNLYYPDRRYKHVVRAAERLGASARELSAFLDWLPSGSVDQKRIDTLELLGVLSQRSRSGFERPTQKEPLSATEAWHELRRTQEPVTTASVQGGDALDMDLLLDELIVAGTLGRATNGGLARAQAQAEQTGNVTVDAVQAAAEILRRELGLHEGPRFDEWLIEQHLSEDQLGEFFQAEAALRRSGALHRSRLGKEIVDYLRSTGEFSTMVARAEEKRAALGTGIAHVPEITDETLFRWFFEERCGSAVRVDLERYLVAEGRITRARFRHALFREWAFHTIARRGL